MKRKESRIVVIVVLVAIFCFAISSYADQGPKPPTQVEVINTPDVNVANTPDVNVANIPDVNIANTPLEIVNGDSQQREPFQAYGGGSIQFNSTWVQAVICTVEADKRLIIDNLTTFMDLKAGDNGYIVLNTWVNGTSAAHYFPFNSVIPYLTSYWAILAKEVTLFADPDTEVQVTCYRNGSGASGGACGVSLTGYLEPVP